MTYTLSDIAIILPSRNNLEYLRLCVQSIRRISPDIKIYALDDNSQDDTWGWLCEQQLTDQNLFIYKYTGNERLGITLSYDYLIDKIKEPIFLISHADMIWHIDSIPNMLELVNKSPQSVISATRIEPPLHPAEPKVKVISDLGIYPYQFDNNAFNDEVERQYRKNSFNGIPNTSKGIFAPWMTLKSHWEAIKGHDHLFVPQSKEDSDIFNRFLLYGLDLVQSWGSFVYHFTSRGSRFANDGDPQVSKNSSEWLKSNQSSHIKFVRKWGDHVRHFNQYPVIHKKYNIGLIYDGNGLEKEFALLEPYFYKVACKPLTSMDIELEFTDKLTSKRGIFNECGIIIELTKPCLGIINKLLHNGLHNELIKYKDVPGSFDFEMGKITINSDNIREIPHSIFPLRKLEYDNLIEIGPNN